MGNYLGASLTDYRLYENPSDPQNSDWRIAIFRSVLKAILNTETGETLDITLGNIQSNLDVHLSNNGIHVTPEWVENISALIAELIAFTQQDFISSEERARWEQAYLNAVAALEMAQNNAGSIANLNGRLLQVEDSVFNEITANLFTVTFDTLTGLNVVRGIWNRTHHRIEC